MSAAEDLAADVEDAIIPDWAYDEPSDRWTLRTRRDAEWAALRIVREQERRDAAFAAADAMMAPALRVIAAGNAAKAAAKSAYEEAHALFEQLLEGWHRVELAEHPKALTITFASGATAKARAGRPSVEFSDPTAYIEWCVDNDRMDLLSVEPSKAEAARCLSPIAEEKDPERIVVERLRSGDQFVPGVRLVTPPRKFTVVTPKAGG